MTEAHQVSVGEVFIDCGTIGSGTIERLYKHQIETIQSKSNVIVLDAPTGSGKTLAAIARVLERNTPTIFVYPTNTLVHDQVKSMDNLLTKLGRRPNLISSENNQDEWIARIDETDIDLIHITGETLEGMAGTSSKGRVMENILKGSFRPNRMRILLTNPDTIYLAFSGRYFLHGRITEELDKFTTIVLDEFHLYSGPTLARIFFMLNDMRVSRSNPRVELIFLSATHGDTLQLLVNTYSHLDHIQVEYHSEAAADRRQIRHLTMCEIHTKNRVMYEDDDIEKAARAIVDLYNSDYEWTGNKLRVKVAAIFSSVVFAANVAAKVSEVLDEEEGTKDVVHQIHGLIPKQVRPKIDKLNEAILVGTSAIEVGVDFDVPFLIMEAHDLASFLQRFGRGGRHNRCKAVLFLPQAIADRLRRESNLTYREILHHAKEAFKVLPSYAGFLCSDYARIILLSMALSGARKKRSRWKRRMEFDYNAALEYYRVLFKSNSYVSMGETCLKVILGNLDDEDIEFGLMNRVVNVMAKYGFLRGSMNSVLVGYPGELVMSPNEVEFSELDILDVLRMNGHLEDIEKYEESIPANLRRRHEYASSIFIVHDFERGGHPRAVLPSWTRIRHEPTIILDSTLNIRHPIGAMRGIAEAILENRNIAYYWHGMNRFLDYRIPRVYVEDENGAVVIGDWALLAKYLQDARGEDSNQ